MNFSQRENNILLFLLCVSTFLHLKCMNVVLLACDLLWNVRRPCRVPRSVTGRALFSCTVVVVVSV